jgi:isocitrate/isopropylmalate dehydrogenase
VLAGDGIGPEITDAAIEVLHAASELTALKLRLLHRLVGWKAREQEGSLLSQDTEQTLRACDGWQQLAYRRGHSQPPLRPGAPECQAHLLGQRL